MTGRPRDCLSSLQYLLKNFPAVAVLGSRQSGKTTLLKQLLPKAPFFDLEKQSDYDRIAKDPEFFLSQYSNQTIILDEAQHLPSLFDALRVAIDKYRQKNGRFLISGSSSPELLKNISESLAGRIATFELSGFSLSEAWKKPRSLFYEVILEKKYGELKNLPSKWSNSQLFDSCFYGGYPQPFLKRRDKKFYSLWMENYYKNYVERDIRSLFPGLNFHTFRNFIKMLGFSSGEIINFSDFSRSLDISQPTVKSYFQICHGTFLWRNLSSYQQNVKKRVIKMPKGEMRDSGLLNFILGIKNREELLANRFAGKIWESFIIEELLKGFSSELISVEPFYYRTQHGAEIDLVLQGPFGILPIEIKLGKTINKHKINSLENFIQEHRLEIGILIHNGSKVEWLTPKIIQIPAAII